MVALVGESCWAAAQIKEGGQMMAGLGGDPEEEGTGGVAAARLDRWDKAPRI